jgi:hypothetical protein
MGIGDLDRDDDPLLGLKRVLPLELLRRGEVPDGGRGPALAVVVDADLLLAAKLLDARLAVQEEDELPLLGK